MHKNQVFKPQSTNYRMQIWQEILILLIALFPRGAVAKEARSCPHPLGLCPAPLVLLLPAARWAESGPRPLVTEFSPGGCIGIADWLVVDKYSIGKPLISSLCQKLLCLHTVDEGLLDHLILSQLKPLEFGSFVGL